MYKRSTLPSLRLSAAGVAGAWGGGGGGARVGLCTRACVRGGCGWGRLARPPLLLLVHRFSHSTACRPTHTAHPPTPPHPTRPPTQRALQRGAQADGVHAVRAVRHHVLHSHLARCLEPLQLVGCIQGGGVACVCGGGGLREARACLRACVCVCVCACARVERWGGQRPPPHPPPRVEAHAAAPPSSPPHKLNTPTHTHARTCGVARLCGDEELVALRAVGHAQRHQALAHCECVAVCGCDLGVKGRWKGGRAAGEGAPPRPARSPCCCRRAHLPTRPARCDSWGQCQ